MEETNEGWIEVIITNKNGPKELDLKEKILRVQLGEIVVMMCVH
jgi:hypothetical protein